MTFVRSYRDAPQFVWMTGCFFDGHPRSFLVVLNGGVLLRSTPLFFSVLSGVFWEPPCTLFNRSAKETSFHSGHASYNFQNPPPTYFSVDRRYFWIQPLLVSGTFVIFRAQTAGSTGEFKFGLKEVISAVFKETRGRRWEKL